MEIYTTPVLPDKTIKLPDELLSALGVDDPAEIVFLVNDDQSVSVSANRYSLRSAAGSVPPLGREIDVEEMIREAKDEKAERDREHGLFGGSTTDAPT